MVGTLTVLLLCACTPEAEWPTPDAEESCLSQHRGDFRQVDFDLDSTLMAADELSQYFDSDPESVAFDYATAYYRVFVACERCEIDGTDLVIPSHGSVTNAVRVYETPEKAQRAYPEFSGGIFTDRRLLVSGSDFPLAKGTESGPCGIGEESCVWYYDERMLDEYAEKMVHNIQVEVLFRRANVLSRVKVEVYSPTGDIDAARQFAIDIATISDQVISAAVAP